jgi:hypothetical protein
MPPLNHAASEPHSCNHPTFIIAPVRALINGAEGLRAAGAPLRMQGDVPKYTRAHANTQQSGTDGPDQFAQIAFTKHHNEAQHCLTCAAPR